MGEGSDHNELTEHRIKLLEDGHSTLAESLDELKVGFVRFSVEARAYARAGLFVFGIIHPVFVGLIIYIVTR